MDKRFLTAFILPDKLDIAGFKLNPLCFRHMLLLEIIDSPFINTAKGVPSYKDIVTFIKICSTKHWTDVPKISFIEKVKFSRIYYDIKHQADVCLCIKKYMEESLSTPKVWVKEDNDVKKTKNTIPRSIYVCTFLISKMGISEENAWNMPIGKAIWYLTTYSALEGSEVNIITTDDEDEKNVKSDLEKLKELEESVRRELIKRKVIKK